MTTDSELIARNLHMLSIEEVEPAVRYRCRLCGSEWQYRNTSLWWKCPTPGCTDWMAAAGPAVTAACRQLSGRRPVAIPGIPAAKRPANRGGRPRRPQIAPEEIERVFATLQAAEGRYPADRDLADALEVHERTILNYRKKGYLPPRSLDEQTGFKK